MLKLDIDIRENDIMDAVMQEAKCAITKKSFEIACPKCNSKISVTSGRNQCRYCGAEINLSLDIL